MTIRERIEQELNNLKPVLGKDMKVVSQDGVLELVKKYLVAEAKLEGKEEIIKVLKNKLGI